MTWLLEIFLTICDRHCFCFLFCLMYFVCVLQSCFCKLSISIFSRNSNTSKPLLRWITFEPMTLGTWVHITRTTFLPFIHCSCYDRSVVDILIFAFWRTKKSTYSYLLHKVCSNSRINSTVINVYCTRTQKYILSSFYFLCNNGGDVEKYVSRR